MHLLLITTVMMLSVTATKAVPTIFAMSIFAWFTKIFDGIGAAFKKLWSKAKPFLDKEIPVAIGIVNVFKACVENPALDFLTELTATNLDNKVLAFGKEYLPQLLEKLKLFDITIKATTPEEVINAAIEFVRSIDPLFRNGKYKELGDYLILAMADGKLSWPEVVHIIQIAHDEKVENAVIAA